MSDNEPIVSKVAEAPALSTLAPIAFAPPTPGGAVEFVMDLTAEALDGARKRAIVKPNLPGWGAFEIRCDEGPSIGGTDSAPAPLAYLAAGVAFCMLTHLKYYVAVHKLDIQTLRIEQRLRFATNERTRRPSDPPECACLGIDMQLIVDSDASESAIRDLSQTAKALCMGHKALLEPTPSVFGVRLNGQALSVVE